MSKKKHDNLGHDENSDMETSHNNEAQHETDHTHVTMSSIEFETKLNEFFTKHKPSKLRHVAKIVSKFKGQEEFVLEHLNNKYVLGIPTVKTKKTAGHKSAEGHDSGHGHAQIEETGAKPKSKKKLIIIIVVVLVVVLGAVGFMMKDKLFGGGHSKEAEHGAPAGHGDVKAAGHDAHGAEAKPTEEAATPPAAPADSAAATTAPAEAAPTEAAPAEHSGH